MLSIARQHKIQLKGKKYVIFRIDVSNETSVSKFGVENHNLLFHGNPFSLHKTPKHMSANNFKKSKNDLKILGVQSVRYVQRSEKYYV
jgi:hypothetical protein